MRNRGHAKYMFIVWRDSRYTMIGKAIRRLGVSIAADIKKDPFRGIKFQIERLRNVDQIIVSDY
jgi:hypothetical protein